MSSSKEELHTCGKEGSVLPSTSTIILLIVSKLVLNFTSISALITKYCYQGITIYKFWGFTILPDYVILLQEPISTEGKLLHFPSSSEVLYNSRFFVVILSTRINKCTP
jgi:hypothetical protein